MNRSELSPVANNEEYKRPEINAVVTNYDRVTSTEGELIGWDRSSKEYEQRGWRGAVQKIKYNFLRQDLMRKHVREAQKEVKKNSSALLLDSRDADAAVQGLSLTDKPYISREEMQAYRESVGLDEKHEDRLDDSEYSAQQQLLQAQLQNLVERLVKHANRADKNHYDTEINAWVSNAISQLPKFYKEEDRGLIAQQISETVEQATTAYDAEVASHNNSAEVAKINLMLAGMAKSGNKGKAAKLLAELGSHPIIWSGASIAFKAFILAAPGVGGAFAAARKWQSVKHDLNRMQKERTHGWQGREDGYRRDLAETFGDQIPAAQLIESMRNALAAVASRDLRSADSAQVDSLVRSIGSLEAIASSKYETIAYTKGEMQQERVQLLKLQAAVQIRLRQLYQNRDRELNGLIARARTRANSEIDRQYTQQEKAQRKLKTKKALQSGAITTGISLAGIGLAAAVPDEWTEAVVDKGRAVGKFAYAELKANANPLGNAYDEVSDYVQSFGVNSASAAEHSPSIEDTSDGQSPVEFEANPITGDGTGGPGYDVLVPESPEAESHSLWQELVDQQDQRDQSNDQYITYGTPVEGEYNELELNYESSGDGEVIINVSGMEGDADGIGGDEFPEDEQLYAIFYLTDHDKEVGNEIRIPIPDDGRLVINEDTHPELLPLFETNDGQVEQQFAVLGIASENDDGSYTFYSSNWSNDISPDLIKEMQQVEVTAEAPVTPGGDTDENGNPIQEVGEAEEEDRPAEEEVSPATDENTDENGNPIQEVGEAEEQDRPAEPEDVEEDDEEEVVPPPIPSKREVFVSPIGPGLTVDHRGQMASLKQDAEQPRDRQSQRPTVTVSEVPNQPEQDSTRANIPGMSPVIPELGPGGSTREPSGLNDLGNDGSVIAMPGPEAGPAPVLEPDKTEDGEPKKPDAEAEKEQPQPAPGGEAGTGTGASTRATGSEPGSASTGAEAAPARRDSSAGSENAGINISIDSERDTNQSGNVVQNNSGSVNFNNNVYNGMTGAEQIRQSEIELDRFEAEKADRQGERDSRDQSEARQIEDRQDERASAATDRDRERQALVEQNRINSEANARAVETMTDLARTGFESMAAQSQKQTDALEKFAESVQNQIREADTQRGESAADKALLASIEANAQAMQTMGTTQQQTIEALNRAVEIAANRPEIDVKPIHDVLAPYLEQQNKLLADLLTEARSGVRSANIPELNVTLSNVQQANAELRPSLRVVTSQSFAELQRARRRAYPRRGRRPRLGRGDTGAGQPTPDVPEATPPVDANPGQPERPEPKQPRPMTEEERQRGRENSAAAMKEDFLHENSSYSFGQDNVNNVRNKARERLRELYPERYKELLPVLRDKITQEFVEPWKQDKGSAAERRQWLEQLYDDAFFAELAGEAPAASVDNPTEPDEPENTPTTTNSGSPRQEQARPEFPVRAEDMDDFYSGQRAQQARINEEFSDTRFGREVIAQQRQRQEERAARKRANGESRTSRPDTESRSSAEVEAPLRVEPINLKELSPNQVDRRDEFNQNNQPSVEEARGIEIYLKRALNFMPLSNPAKNSLRPDFDRQVEQFMAAWQAGNTTAEDRESRMNEIFSGELVNNLIRERQAEGSTSTEAAADATEAQQPTERQRPDGSVQTLERLVKRFGERRPMTRNIVSPPEFESEDINQQHQALSSHIDQIKSENELTDYQVGVLDDINTSANELRQTMLEANLAQLLSSLANAQESTRTNINTWSVVEKPNEVSSEEFKAQQVERARSQIVQPLREQREVLLKAVTEVFQNLSSLRDQLSESRVYIEGSQGAEEFFETANEYILRLEEAAGRINEQLSDINDLIQDFEPVLDEWQHAP